TWTVSPGSSTPLTLELPPSTGFESTAMTCGVVGPVVIRPIWLAFASVNQRLPSGPAAIPTGRLSAVGTGNSVTAPAVVILPIWFASDSVHQTLPPRPAAM